MEALQFISGIIGLAVLIVYFIQAASISEIKNTLNSIAIKQNATTDYSNYYNEGLKLEYLNKKQEALECYYQADYYAQKYLLQNSKNNKALQNRKIIADKIVSLGGIVQEIPNPKN